MPDMELQGRQSLEESRTSRALLLLALLVFAVYSNTFHTSWQFDDKPNIVNNQRLHIMDLSPGSLWQTFFAKAGSNDLFRPLSSLSLALNWYLGPNETFGFHLVNVAIHILNAYLLFLVCRLLLQTPNLKGAYTREDAHFIAFLCAALWAVNPIQIQAVTYIVQRMASLAALFYLLAMFSYLRGRRAWPQKSRPVYLAACLVCYACAVLSKENAAMLPFCLILVEFAFFRKIEWNRIKAVYFIVAGGAALAILISGVWLSKCGAFEFIFSGYATRPFTLLERILTQPRIVLYYVSQIFYPLPSRLSIAHDVAVSTSLYTPWSTLPAIVAVGVLLGGGMVIMRKRPLAGFAILFFFLNHVIESTILPLELVFEHRNYLPSLFIFLPIAAAIRFLFKHYNKKSRTMVAILTGFVALVIIGLGCFTYVRNHAWQTETSLWHDAMQKAPQSARPVRNLAIQIGWQPNPTRQDYEIALAMFEKALTLNMTRSYFMSEIMNNIGMIYHELGAYQKAIDMSRKALDLHPGSHKIRRDLISHLNMMQKWEQASMEADYLIHNEDRFYKKESYSLKGFILLWQKRPEDALAYFKEAMKKRVPDDALMLNVGVALSLVGKHDQAEGILKTLSNHTVGDIRPHFALIENSARAGDRSKAEMHAKIMLDEFSPLAVMKGLNTLSYNFRTAPIEAEMISPIVKQAMLCETAAIERFSSATSEARGL